MTCSFRFFCTPKIKFSFFRRLYIMLDRDPPLLYSALSTNHPFPNLDTTSPLPPPPWPVSIQIPEYPLTLLTAQRSAPADATVKNSLPFLSNGAYENYPLLECKLYPSHPSRGSEVVGVGVPPSIGMTLKVSPWAGTYWLRGSVGFTFDKKIYLWS
jgi:hypothetical protein